MDHHGVSPILWDHYAMLVLLPDGRKALYDLWRGTVTLDDGAARPMAEVALPPQIASRLAGSP